MVTTHKFYFIILYIYISVLCVSVSVFFITNPTRQLYFKNNKFKIYRPTGDKSSEAKFYFSEMQSDEIDEHKANTTILALQRMCSKHDITDIYLEGWTKINFCL